MGGCTEKFLSTASGSAVVPVMELRLATSQQGPNSKRTLAWMNVACTTNDDVDDERRLAETQHVHRHISEPCVTATSTRCSREPASQSIASAE